MLSEENVRSRFRPGDALIIVDLQNDFCPGGAVPVEHGDEVIPVINRWITAARKAGVPVFASRDWHPTDHMSFEAQGGTWPPRCVRNTPGAAFHPGVQFDADTIIVDKGTEPGREAYSAFDRTGLERRLHDLGVERTWVAGLALDYCVKATALEAMRRAGVTFEDIP